jgi:hypothetical protein
MFIFGRRKPEQERIQIYAEEDKQLKDCMSFYRELVKEWAPYEKRELTGLEKQNWIKTINLGLKNTVDRLNYTLIKFNKYKILTKDKTGLYLDIQQVILHLMFIHNDLMENDQQSELLFKTSMKPLFDQFNIYFADITEKDVQKRIRLKQQLPAIPRRMPVNPIK